MEEETLASTFFCLSVCFHTALLLVVGCFWFFNLNSTLTCSKAASQMHEGFSFVFPTNFYPLARLTDLTSPLKIYLCLLPMLKNKKK